MNAHNISLLTPEVISIMKREHTVQGTGQNFALPVDPGNRAFGPCISMSLINVPFAFVGEANVPLFPASFG